LLAVRLLESWQIPQSHYVKVVFREWDESERQRDEEMRGKRRDGSQGKRRGIDFRASLGSSA
jgi:hypothetical protein